MFLLATLLCSVPIGKGFGLVAVLSGINRDSLDLLSGAAFSGELERPVKLNISVINNANNAERDQQSQMGRIQYNIDGPSLGTERLQRGKTYM